MRGVWKKYWLWLVVLLVVLGSEKLWVAHISRQIAADDYEITSVIEEYRSVVETDNNDEFGRICSHRRRWAYAFALCLRFRSENPDHELEGFRKPNDQIRVIYINPRSLTAWTRLFWNNQAYAKAGTPIGVQVAWINGDGNWDVIANPPSFPFDIEPSLNSGQSFFPIESAEWRN